MVVVVADGLDDNCFEAVEITPVEVWNCEGDG